MVYILAAINLALIAADKITSANGFALGATELGPLAGKSTGSLILFGLLEAALVGGLAHVLSDHPQGWLTQAILMVPLAFVVINNVRVIRRLSD